MFSVIIRIFFAMFLKCLLTIYSLEGTEQFPAHFSLLISCDLPLQVFTPCLIPPLSVCETGDLPLNREDGRDDAMSFLRLHYVILYNSLSSQQTCCRVSLAGSEKASYRIVDWLCGRPTQQGIEGGLGKQRPQTYSSKELNSTNSHLNLDRNPRLRKLCLTS